MNFRLWTIPGSCALLLLLASYPLAAGEEGNADARPQRHRMRDMNRESMLTEFDADGDGVLSDEEKATMRETVRRRMNKRFDENGDGVLSDEEKKKAHDKMRAYLLKRFDKDGDGQLSEAEREEMRKADVPPLPFPEVADDSSTADDTEPIDPMLEALPLPQPPSTEK